MALATAAILLTGCGPREDQATPKVVPERTPGTLGADPGVPPIVLAEAYRVAGVDGASVDQPYAITASITGDRIHLTADCLNFAWSYTLSGHRIATDRTAVESCARGPTPAEAAIVAAFDAAATIARTPGNAIELRGGDHSITLFAQ